MHITTQRLKALRRILKNRSIDCYLISSTDPHHNEYVPPCWQWRAWISGFKGSYGHVCITQDQALLWTDSRYFIEAEQAIEHTPFQLMKMGVTGVLSLEEWLKENIQSACIGFDAKQWSWDAFQKLQHVLEDRAITWQALEDNLLNSLWLDRPSVPATAVHIWPQAIAGLSALDKIKQVQKQMVLNGVDYHVISHLDAIAWLLNIRAQDIPYNPLALSYCVIGPERTYWFVQRGVCTPKQSESFFKQDILVKDYIDFEAFLLGLQGSVWVDTRKTSVSVVKHLKSATLFKSASPIDLMKACKNFLEQEGMRRAHVEDGLSLLHFILWFQQQGLGKRETEIAHYLELYRQRSPDYQGPSFQTISGFGPNGAIVHYAAQAELDAVIRDDNLYLLDSGGQYPYGTTDITRVFHLGEPTAPMKEHYTRVLKGHLALSRVIFPVGTTGSALDVLARAALWEQGLNFGHGTGHGVGCYLCVHEGPQGISPKNHEPLKAGMILSNEPGYYWSGHYGIRIENLMLVIPHPDFQDFLCFETLTLCPYERKLIDLTLLSPEEISWINAYHARIFKVFSTDFQEKKLLDDLTALTAPLYSNPN